MQEALSANERRKDARVKIRDPLKVTDLRSGVLLGTLVNINVQGIMLLSPALITVDKEFHLDLELPEVIDGSRNIRFKTLSMWSDSVLGSPADCWTGFSITDIQPADIERIEKLIGEDLRAK